MAVLRTDMRRDRLGRYCAAMLAANRDLERGQWDKQIVKRDHGLSLSLSYIYISQMPGCSSLVLHLSKPALRLPTDPMRKSCLLLLLPPIAPLPHLRAPFGATPSNWNP
jgi:hypothetical protein